MAPTRPLVALAKEAHALLSQIRAIVGNVDNATILQLVASLASQEEKPKPREAPTRNALVKLPNRPAQITPNGHILDQLAAIMGADAYDVGSLRTKLEVEAGRTITRGYMAVSLTEGVQSGWLVRVERGFYRMSEDALQAAAGGLLWREWKRGRPDEEAPAPL